jgi:hypothetical protein
VIRIVTNADHLIRPYFMNPNKLDEYAMRPRNSQPHKRNCIKIQQTAWKPVNEKQFDVGLSAFGPGTSREGYRTETARALDEDYGKHFRIYTHRLKIGDKVGYAIVKEEHMIKKRILPHNTVFSAKQSAIIKAIQSEKNNKH